MTQVFIDTAYLIASLSPRDALHQRAKDATDRLELADFITTDLVLIELLNHYAAQGNFWRNQAASFVAELIQHSQVELVIHGRGMLIATLEFYHKRQDKGYSFTDCLSMLIMRDRGITQVLTDDKHFRQEGFQTLL